jgi:two-component system, NtrC family, sensor kinase
MRRHSKEGREPVKARRRKTVTRKRRNAPKAERRRIIADTQQTELAQVIRERDEALEQQAAITGILRVISNSPTDVQPVLDSVAKHAARICEAHIVEIAIVDNEMFRLTASFGAAERPSREESLPLDRSSIAGRAMCDPQPVQVADMQNAGDDFSLGRKLAIRHGHRTALSVPLIREGHALGAIVIRRTEVRPFEDKHVALLKAFADQAAIAIENVRLFEAQQQRTRELSESLEQQTATSELLQVISSSPGDLQPVFQAMLENAVHICDAGFGEIFRWEGDGLRLVATHKTPAAFAEVLRRKQQFRPVTTKSPIHIADLAADRRYVERSSPTIVTAVELGGIRTALTVPMLKENELIGTFVLGRQEVRPFTEKQIELVQNFAAQAVIAIENARLLNELRQRTNDLTESLEQQTATSDVLRVISSSPSDIQPVLEIIDERAEKLCNAEISVVSTVDGELIRLASIHGMTEAGVEATRRSFPAQRTDERVTARAIRTRSVCHVADVLSDPQYQYKDTARVIGLRGCLGVPMVRDEQVVGGDLCCQETARIIFRHTSSAPQNLCRPGGDRNRTQQCQRKLWLFHRSIKGVNRRNSGRNTRAH